MPKVSIIVPVYNVAPYLHQCLDSLLSQTLHDIEIILVDDGSTDKSRELCDEYTEKDNRIKVIHKPNEGLSAARNDGVEISTSPYIMFVDADDWAEPEFCELPYTVAEKNDADLVLFNHNRIQSDGRVSRIDAVLSEGAISESEALYYNSYISRGAWIALYRRNLFDNIRYPVEKYYEDIGTSHRLIHAAKRVYYLNAALYNRNIDRPGSITTDPATRDHPDKREMHLSRVKDLISWGYEDYAVLYVFPQLILHGINSEEQKPLVDIVKRIQRAPECFTWKQKLMLHIFRFSPPLFDLICKLTGKRIKDNPH